MPDLTPNHPAVEAATFAQWSVQSESHWCPYADVSDVTKDRWRKGTALALTAALPHLTADDLRNTPAGRELMAEGWAEGMLDHMGRGHVGSMSPKTISIIRERIADANPYRKADA